MLAVLLDHASFHPRILLPVMRAPMIYCRGFTGRATDPDITLSSPQPSCSTIEHLDPGSVELVHGTVALLNILCEIGNDPEAQHNAQYNG